MDFRLHAVRFEFRATDSIRFPEGKSGNILRGTFGSIFKRLACEPDCPGARTCPVRRSCAYARMFEPHAEDGPSGLADPPRPFVFRAAHLDGRTLEPGEGFHFDLHVFDTRADAVRYFERSFAEVALEGMGPRRGRARLLSVTCDPVTISLTTEDREMHNVRIDFLTPTELKGGDGGPDFATVFARARDRVSTLRALYGEGAPDLDFRGLGERSRAVKLLRCELHHVEAERRSSRTRQTHSIGGFTGIAEYEGACREFLPILRAAQWTGVGRQTVWGKGAIKVTPR